MTGIDEISDEVQKLITYNFDQAEPEFNSLQIDKPTFIIWIKMAFFTKEIHFLF